MPGEIDPKAHVAPLMALYFENFTGEIQPSRPVMAGHLLNVLKETTANVLAPLVISVAQDGMMLTRNTLLLAAKKKKGPVSKPTPIPPRYEAQDNPDAVPMPDYVKEIFKKPKHQPAYSDFDLDFNYGKEGENLVEELLTNGKTVEVKRDRKWHTTGNLFVEVECWYQRSQSWEPSGLMASKADYWAFVLEQGVLMVPRSHVQYAITYHGKEITCEIPPNRSKGYLITVDNLLDATRQLRDT